MARKAKVTTSANLGQSTDTSSHSEESKIVHGLPKEPAPKEFDYPGIENENVRLKRNTNGVAFDKGSTEEAMYLHLSAQPKVPIYVPLKNGESPKSEQWVQLNGLAILIKKGHMVLLPQQVVEVLTESLKLTDDALHPYIMDGDGRVVRANLTDKPRTEALE